MSKATRQLKKAADKIIHSPVLNITLPAGLAGPGAPLGTALGQASFSKYI